MTRQERESAQVEEEESGGETCPTTSTRELTSLSKSSPPSTARGEAYRSPCSVIIGRVSILEEGEEGESCFGLVLISFLHVLIS